MAGKPKTDHYRHILVIAVKKQTRKMHSQRGQTSRQQQSEWTPLHKAMVSQNLRMMLWGRSVSVLQEWPHTHYIQMCACAQTRTHTHTHTHTRSFLLVRQRLAEWSLWCVDKLNIVFRQSLCCLHKGLWYLKQHIFPCVQEQKSFFFLFPPAYILVYDLSSSSSVEWPPSSDGRSGLC